MACEVDVLFLFIPVYMHIIHVKIIMYMEQLPLRLFLHTRQHVTQMSNVSNSRPESTPSSTDTI